MEKMFLSLVAVGVFFSMGAQASPVEVSANLTKIYAPEGFDSNDNVQIVGEGYYPNSCYRPAKTSVTVDKKTKTIVVESTAYRYDGMCLQVILPFDQVLDIGVLGEGDYSVIRANKPDAIGKLRIAKATTVSADDFLYAPVDQAFLSQGGGRKVISLTGQFPVSCMKMKKVLKDIQTDVIVLQPVVEMDSSQECIDGQFAFQANVDVSNIKSGKYLIHVRSMNGKAINSIVSVRP